MLNNISKYSRTRAFLEINKKAFVDNLKIIQKINKKRLLLIIKDNAYGMGDVELAKISAKVAYGYAVATIEEALRLRENGIKKVLYIIGIIHKEAYEVAIENDIVITIEDFAMAKKLDSIAKKMGKKVKLNFAVNTGMNRIGFNVRTGFDEIVKVSKLKNVEMFGIYTHLIVADDKGNVDKKAFTDKQVDNFHSLIIKLSEVNINFVDVSVNNSAGSLYKYADFTNVLRPGIIMYGSMPTVLMKNVYGLKTVVSFKSRIVCVKDIKKGDYVSYGFSYRAEKNMKIATVSVGYGDGYSRALSNKGKVIINDKLCKVVGNVTMDFIMVDVTGVECKTNDIVVIIGKSKTKEITADEVAYLAQTISCETLVSINNRVPRIYV